MLPSASRSVPQRWALHAAAAMAVAAALVAGGCGDQTRTLRLEIPRQSGQSKAQSGPREEVRARVGDRLVVTNHDKYLQIVAGHPVRASETVTIPLTRPGRFETACSGHRKRSVTLVVSSR